VTLNDESRCKTERKTRNRRDYEKSKATQDQLLLRLDKGELERLNAASKAVGVSRAAFVRMFLTPTLGAVASHMADIDKARSTRGQSLSQFLSAAITASLSAPEPQAIPAESAAAEFDALFGPSDGSD
jgi:hypothetical protein